ncbi:MAG: FecR domain-containing protein, partial [Rhodospirillaceae bacterium]
MAANDDTTGRMDEAAGDGAPLTTGDTPAGENADSIIGGTDSGQVAQAGGAEPVGQVESLSGTVVAVRADGTRVELKTGDPIYQGDTLETSADGAVGVMLADQTTFSMANNGQMVIDQMVYDPGTNEGSISMSVVEGVFAFVSGQIAKTDPDALSLNTPVATIGIRGTQVGIEVGEDKPMTVVLMEEADGFVGEVVVANDGGVQILNQAFQATNVASSNSAPSESYIYDIQQLIQKFRGALGSLPTTNGNNANNYGVQPDAQREQTQQEQTQNENLTDEQLTEEETTGEAAQNEGEGEERQEEQLAVEETGEPDPNELADFETAAGGEENEGFDTEFIDVTPPVDLKLVLMPSVPVPPPNDPVLLNDLNDDEPETEQNEAVIESAVIESNASTPDIEVEDVEGVEDQEGGITLDLRADLEDTDGSETLSVTISGLPQDAIITIGTNEYIPTGPAGGPFSVTITNASDLANLEQAKLTPPQDFSGELNLTFSATATESNGGETALTSANFTVDISRVADDPTVGANNVTGVEDTAISLDVTAATTDLDGSEELSVTIFNVPDGAEFSLGSDNGDGSWTIPNEEIGDLANLTFTPPTDYFGTINLTVQATASEDGTEATSDIVGFQIIVEDDNIIVGTPDDDVLTGGDDADDISGLAGDDTIDGGQGDDTIDGGSGEDTAVYGGNFDNYTIVVYENGDVTISGPDGTDQLTNIETLQFSNGSVDVADIGLPPIISFETAQGDEDTAIDLTITAETANPLANVEVITIEGIPAGSTLVSGTDELQPEADGSYLLSPEQLENLSLTPPQDFNGDLSLDITASTSEGVSSEAPTVMPVNVISVDDAPDVTTVNVDDALEDDAEIDLDISAVFPDSTETVESITIAGVPAGATLSAGTDNGDGSWTLTPGELTGLSLTALVGSSADISLQVTATSTDGGVSDPVALNVQIDAVAEEGTVAGGGAGAEDTAIDLNLTTSIPGGDDDTVESITISGLPAGATLSAGTDNGDGTFTIDAADIAGLQVTPPAGSSADFNLDVTVTTQDVDPETGAVTTTSTPSSIAVQVDAVAEEGTVAGGGTGAEDTAIDLNLTTSIPGGDDDTVESITISGLPAGATLSAGTDNGDGTFTIDAADIAGLQVTPPAGSSADFNLDVTVTTQDVDPETGEVTATTSDIPLNVTVNAVVGEATVTAQDVTADEDTAIALDITASLPEGSDDTITEVTIEGVPAGATLSAGTDNGDGTWTLSAGDLAGLTVTPAAGDSTDFTLQVNATTQDVDPETGEVTATTSDIPLNVTINAVVGEATVTAQDVTADEDTAIALDITASLPEGSDDTITEVTIEGVPAGATLSAGTDNGDGTWTLSAGDLAGLTVTPAAGDSTDFTLQVNATTQDVDPETGEVTATTSDIPLNVTINAVVGEATVTAQDVTADEDTAIALDITASLPEGSDDTIAEVTIEGVPAGATLSAGTDNGDGTWTLSAGDLNGLTVTPLAGDSTDFTLQVNATTQDIDPETGAVTTTSTPAVVSVQVNAVVGEATVTTQDVTANEDTAIALDITASLPEGSDDTITEVTISGVPAGAQLSAGTDNGDGSWTLSPADLANLTVTPAAGDSTDFTLQVNATSQDVDPETGAVTTTTTNVPLNVTVDAVADEGAVAGGGTGAEDTAIALNLSTSIPGGDDDTVESITISNLPEGAVLSAGTDNGDGTFTVQAADIAGLTITPPAGSSADFAID